MPTHCFNTPPETFDDTIEMVLRVLGITVFQDRMKLIVRAIQSKEKRDVENAIEALESGLHAHLRDLLVPLLGDRSMSEKLAAGRERLGKELFAAASLKEVLKEITNDSDPVIQSLGLYALGEMDRDEIVFREGMPYDRFYLLYAGRVSLIMGADTAQPKLLEYIDANRFFGELSLIDSAHQPYTVKVDADALIYTLKADDFLRVLKDYPSVSLNLCQVFIQRLRDYQIRLVSAPSDEAAG